MSHWHSCKISQKGGKCPTVILTRFHKKEENVPLSFWQVFNKRRKMSHCHSEKFSKKKENVQLSFWHVFTKRRKMSHCHSNKFLQKGGKCLKIVINNVLILGTFHSGLKRSSFITHRNFQFFNAKSKKELTHLRLLCTFLCMVLKTLVHHKSSHVFVCMYTGQVNPTQGLLLAK